jgi:hypothetical protein
MKMFEVSGDVSEPNVAIGDEIVEALHEFGFRQNRQLMERFPNAARMEPAVKAGVIVCEGPQPTELDYLVGCNLFCVPTLATTERATH